MAIKMRDRLSAFTVSTMLGDYVVTLQWSRFDRLGNSQYTAIVSPIRPCEVLGVSVPSDAAAYRLTAIGYETGSELAEKAARLHESETL